jgi:hypothetical protein
MRQLCSRAAVASLAFAGVAHAQYTGPFPYLSAADSPFPAATFDFFHLEDFEDEALTTGLAALNGERIGPSNFTDSVDSDDGSIDGSGLAGSSYITDGFSSSLEFSFDATALGSFPTHAGFVWTDVGNVFQGPVGFATLTFEAFDALGETMGVYGPFTLGDGASTGATAEDRFFGVANPAGISRLVVSMPDSIDWEVDHVQYGRIPAPAAALPAMTLVLVLRRRR